MKKIKLAIVIPTFNRIEKLKVALQHIEMQIIDTSVELYCVISNTASSDQTSEFLNNLKSTEKVKYLILNKPEINEWRNTLSCVKFIPEYIDWVWFHGDDDFLFSNDAVQIIANQINDEINQNVTLIHACQARRSRNTGTIHSGKLFDLCNAIGYHEMLGWMSSLVVKRDNFVFGLLKYFNKSEGINNADDLIKLKLSAYTHSVALFEECKEDETLFIDLPLIEPQDKVQDELSIERWKRDNTIQRYFFVIDDLLNLKEKGLINNNLTPTFFRYLNYSLWDKLLANIIGSVIMNGNLSDEQRENLHRIKKISTLIGDSYDVKIFNQHCLAVEEALENYDLSVKVMKIKTKQLERLFSSTNTASYPFKVLRDDGAHFG